MTFSQRKDFNKLLQDFGLEELEAAQLRQCYVIRPKGCLGTFGWKNNKPWTALFIATIPQGVALAAE